MIAYSPIDGDVRQRIVPYRPKTCFVMTQLGEPQSSTLASLRLELSTAIREAGFSEIDASQQVTGRDFLLKIWEMILSVPVGIAVVTEDFTKQTFANIFYELGMMHALGKETLVVKTAGAPVPSDFVRTEYLRFDSRFRSGIERYFGGLAERSDYYATVASTVEENPLLAIDYYKRAFLISGEMRFKESAARILEQNYLHPLLTSLRIPDLIDFSWMM